MSMEPINSLVIKGAREHNLRNISLELPRNRLIVFTGLSGSGKSSLAFDTIYAEGQRRYVESLSAYARQFLGQMDKPDVDFIEGLSPAISIDQKSASANPRSTVGTITEIYDYLRLLYARIGKPYCPNCGQPISRQSPQQIVDRIMSLPEGNRFLVLAPVVRGRKGEYEALLAELLKKGFTRALIDGEEADLRTDRDERLARYEQHTIEVVVDRLVRRDGIEARLTDSVETALGLSKGIVEIEVLDSERRTRESNSIETRDSSSAKGGFVDAGLSGSSFLRDRAGVIAYRSDPTGGVRDIHSEVGSGAGMVADRGDPPGSGKDGSVGSSASTPEQQGGMKLVFSENLACTNCGFSFEELTPRSFSFNSPYGACPHCAGLGVTFEVDPELVVPDPTLSISQGAIKPWADSRGEYFSRLLEAVAEAYGFSTTVPWSKLRKHDQEVLLNGSGNKEIEVRYRNRFGRMRTWRTRYEGVVNYLKRRHDEADSDYQREATEAFMREVPCPSCKGTRLKPESLSVYVGEWNIHQLCDMSISRTASALANLQLSKLERFIAERILKEINARIQFLLDVGLDYLTLNRPASTLAGGEAQRIRLASQIGSGLVGVLYVLDEPSIGLHQRDNRRLIGTLTRLRDMGNTVIVVEHDEEMIRHADHLVDIGPGAGEHGGEVVCSGGLDDLLHCERSITGAYLRGSKCIQVPKHRRKPGAEWLTVRGAKEHNLADIDVAFPLGCLIAVTGVSGSGKSTLVNDILLKALMQRIYRSKLNPGRHDAIEGVEAIDKVVNIDQSPIGRTPRSSPATYTGVFDHIRRLFAESQEAKVAGYRPGRFSYNVKGGRCEACGGEGTVRIEMHFLPDIYVPCEVCGGKRYNRDTLRILFKGKTIADVLSLSVEEARELFSNQPSILRYLDILAEVGLGYIRLGQSAPTLSGGEAQRVKLASELVKRPTGHTFYILDEPTTGLHFEDVNKLLKVLNKLVEQGNTVVVIEHNLDVVKTADWIIDLGPEGGDGGGRVVATGTPEEVALSGTYTGIELSKVLSLVSPSSRSTTVSDSSGEVFRDNSGEKRPEVLC
ncbi:MAG: excinuclease ABC subunit UvrA [Actinobacteria bacterium]|nr:excinuclease ABC subunit UvrA [Actinomycetota bacterium]